MTLRFSQISCLELGVLGTYINVKRESTPSKRVCGSLERVIVMALVPYTDYDNGIRRAWPFNAFDDFFAPITNWASSDAFKMDVEDAGDKYVVSAHLPGVKKDEVDVELNEGRLSISVDKKESDEDKQKNYVQKETGEWKATRGIYLKDAAKEGVTAKLEDGVLTVSVPKAGQEKNATKVTIE